MLPSTAWNALKLALVGVGAVVAGYAVVALLSELVQQVWLGGVSYRHSAIWVLALAGVFTPAGGVVGGVVAGAIGRRSPLAHGLALATVIAAETTYLVATHRVDGPLWFEAGAGATLAAAVVFGSWLVGRWLRKTVTELPR